MAYNQPYYTGGYYPQYQNGAVPDTLNQFKSQYQPQMVMQQPIQQMPMQPTQMPVSSDMIWVLSEVEAQSYPVAPNNSVILWDKNNDVIYIKSVNAQGVPSMRILDYTERIPEMPSKTPVQHECTCKKDFVPMETFNALVGQIDVLRAKVDAISVANKSKAKNKEDVDNG